MRLRELQFWHDTVSLSKFSAAPFAGKPAPHGCLTVMWRGGGLCSRGGSVKNSTLRKFSEKSRAVGLVRSIDGGSGVVFSGLCSL